MAIQTITPPPVDAHDPKASFATGFAAVMTKEGWEQVSRPEDEFPSGWTTFTADMGPRQWRASYDQTADALIVWHGFTCPDMRLHASDAGILAAVDWLRDLRVLRPAA